MGIRTGTVENMVGQRGKVMKEFLSFYKGKKVLVTGHTGFKGSWLCKILTEAGAEVTGYSLEPPTEPALFALSGLEQKMHSILGDVRHLEHLQQVFAEVQPECVFHLAAQPIVRESYRDPVGTYATNVMGTVHVLECVRQNACVRSVLNVTTDKVYENREWEWGYRETDPLDGYDPYSNSKSCSELVTHSYRKSFFTESYPAVSTARAGNVIGGGDFAADRIIPDCVRAAMKGQAIEVRNPNSTRPYQHVLEPLAAYLQIVAVQWEHPELAGYYNVGPEEADCRTTGELVTMFCDKWGEQMTWHSRQENGPHEASFLKLDCSRLKRTFGWAPKWSVEDAVARTVEWSKNWIAGGSVEACMEQQIREFFQ